VDPHADAIRDAAAATTATADKHAHTATKNDSYAFTDGCSAAPTDRQSDALFDPCSFAYANGHANACDSGNGLGTPKLCVAFRVG
jgi:hypothetical protein